MEGRDGKRLAYQGKIEAQLKEWGSQIDRWQARITAGTQQPIIEELNRKRQTVRRKLGEMRDASPDQWMHLRAEMDQAVDDMQRTVNQAREKFPRP